MRCMAMVLAAGLAAASLEAAVYHVGPGQARTAIGQVPWNHLTAGDTVYIHWRSDADGGPYREKINLSGQGTASQHIRILGVPGPAGQLPVLDGQNATTASTGNATLYTAHQQRGLITLTRSSSSQSYADYKPRYIDIENLCVRNAYAGYTFTDSTGAPRSYAANAAAIYIERGENITIRNCQITGSGNGFFAGSANTLPGDGGMIRHILFEGNSVYGNGNVGSDRQHNIYTECVDIVFQNNYLGPLRAGSGGNNLKDRSAGLVVRYNWIETGANLLDLVDPENSSGVTNLEATYRHTWVYGNILRQDGTAGMRRIVHYGGDTGIPSNYRKGTLHFYNNTVDFCAPQSAIWYGVLFKLETNDESAEVRNNILARLQPDPDQPVTLTELWLNTQYGVLNFGVNWVDRNWFGSRVAGGTLNGTSNFLLGSDPGLYGAAAGALWYSPRPGASAAINAAGAGDPAAGAYPLLWQYLLHQSVQDRLLHGLALDLGALEFLPKPGDANFDGQVNLSDLTILANHYGQTGAWTWLDGDFNADARLDISDLTLMANYYGAVEMVPAPGAGGPLLLGLTVLLRRRRRRA